MRIHVLALDGVFDTGLATILDALATANELASAAGTNTRFDVRVRGVRTRVRTAHGLRVPLDTTRTRATPDWVVIPAIGARQPETLEPALARADVRDAADLLHDSAHAGASLAAACIGTFVLAESGLLDGHESTTTWWLAPFFRRRYPHVRLDESRMIVRSGRRVTAGAALSHMDLALWLVRQASPRLAALVAKYLVVDARPSQSAYVLVDHLTHADPIVERFEHWARGRLGQPFSLDEAATSVGASKRTLARRLAAAIDRTPLSYFQELRVERAVHLLKTTDESVDRIAARVGYADGVTLRALLRRRLGRGVRDLRGATPP